MVTEPVELTSRIAIRCFAASFAVFVVTIGGCLMHEDAMVARMVESGADPVAAGCAYNNERSLCAAYVATRR